MDDYQLIHLVHYTFYYTMIGPFNIYYKLGDDTQTQFNFKLFQICFSSLSFGGVLSLFKIKVLPAVIIGDVDVMCIYMCVCCVCNNTG